MNAQKVLVAMSGGLKSLITAWLLKMQGMQVRGVYFDLGSHPNSEGNIHALERKLGISVQVIAAKEEFHALFAEARDRAALSGETLDVGLFFQQFYLLPKLLEMKLNHQFQKIATGHRALIQKDQVAKRVRVFQNADGDLRQTLSFLKLDQDALSSFLLPLGSIPESMFIKLSKELMSAEESVSLTWANEFDLPEIDSHHLFEAILENGVPAGTYQRATPPSPGMKYKNLDRMDVVYRIIDVSLHAKQILVKPIHELQIKEVWVQDVSWFHKSDLGFSSLNCGLISLGRDKPIPVSLLQYEGARIKAYLNQPLSGEEANIFKGQTVLWVEGSEILGGGRVFGTH